MKPLILKIGSDFDLTQYLQKNYSQDSASLLSLIMIKVLPDKKNISIDQVRDLKKILLNGSTKHLIVFERFELCTNEAQNALLKLLEEQGFYHQFILLSQNPQEIIETVHSRCVYKSLVEVSKIEDTYQDIEKILKNLMLGNIKQVFEDTEFQKSTSEEAINFLTKVLMVLEKKLASGDNKVIFLIKNTLFCQKLINIYNVNPQMALDLWLLKSIK